MGFIDVIKERAKSSIKTIVLPETEDMRTLEAADKILKEGEIIGMGNHRDLLNTCEAYKEISESQIGGSFID